MEERKWRGLCVLCVNVLFICVRNAWFTRLRSVFFCFPFLSVCAIGELISLYGNCLLTLLDPRGCHRKKNDKKFSSSAIHEYCRCPAAARQVGNEGHAEPPCRTTPGFVVAETSTRTIPPWSCSGGCCNQSSPHFCFCFCHFFPFASRRRASSVSPLPLVVVGFCVSGVCRKAGVGTTAAPSYIVFCSTAVHI